LTEKRQRDRDSYVSEKNNQELIKQIRIASTGKDKYIHAIDIIIEWHAMKKATIPLSEFNFVRRQSQLLRKFLCKLKNLRCYKNYEFNPYKDALNAEVTINKINLRKLKNYRNKLLTISKLSNLKIMYYPDNHRFYVNDKYRVLNRGSADLMDYIFKNKMSKKSEHYIGEIYSYIEGVPWSELKNQSKYKLKLYFTGRRINQFINQHYELSDFLKFTKLKVRINRNYLPFVK